MAAVKYGRAGQLLLRRIRAQLREDGLVPDARDEALLDTAARLSDRMADLEAMIAADGERTMSDSGFVRMHPGVAEYRQHAVALAKVLSSVAMAESVAGKNPAKVRAATTRWRAHNVAKQRPATVAG